MSKFTHKCRFCGVPIALDGKRYSNEIRPYGGAAEYIEVVREAWTDGILCICRETRRWHEPPDPVPVDVAIRELLDIASSS